MFFGVFQIEISFNSCQDGDFVFLNVEKHRQHLTEADVEIQVFQLAEN